jgi:hypothetical protein
MSGSLFGMLIAALFAAQATQPAKPGKQPASISVTGCISQDAATPGSYLFSDTSTGARYRLSGFDGRKDSEQGGQLVVGTGSGRVTIRGGLVPSPNLAAQAGALDPAKTANARTAGGSGGMASAALPEFRVERVQAIGGSCR